MAFASVKAVYFIIKYKTHYKIMNIYYSTYDCSVFDKRSKNEKQLVSKIRENLLSTSFLKEKGIPFSKCEIYYNKYGKPLIKDNSFYFNLSHTRGLLCCAISDRPIGIDCEFVRPFDNRLINKVLTENERRDLYLSPSPQTEFFKYWTLKESYVKMKGVGITYPFSKISFNFDNENIISSDPQAYFKILRIEECFVSVCTDIRISSEINVIKIN